jgi:zinc transporter ZupT
MNLFPESVHLFDALYPDDPALSRCYSALCVIGGMLFSLMMERVIPHSHAHEHPIAQSVPMNVIDPEQPQQPEEHGVQAKSPKEVTLDVFDPTEVTERVSFSGAGALILHHLPEGMMCFLSMYHDWQFGLLVSFALAVHDMPSGICIALPMYLSTGSKTKPFLLCLLAAFTYVLGGLFGWLLIEVAAEETTDTIMAVLFGLTSGVMLYVSFVELLPAAITAANRHRETESKDTLIDQHAHQGTYIYKATIASVFAGFLVMEVGNILLAKSGGHSH